MDRIIPLLNDLHGENNYERAADCEDRPDDARDCIECCKAEYYDGDTPDYTCDQKRRIYLLRYLAAHTAQGKHAMSMLPDDVLEAIFEREEIRVLSIGGGPGSDLAGFSSFLHSRRDLIRRNQRIELTRMDRQGEWDHLAGRVEELWDIDGVDPWIHWQEDIVEPEFEEDPHDLILMSYFLSEISDDQLRRLSANLASLSHENTVFVFVDRDQTEVEDRVLALCRRLGANVAVSVVDETWIGFSYPEELRQLCQSKLKPRAYFCVAVGCDAN